jgi:hypothetical protein
MKHPLLTTLLLACSIGAADAAAAERSAQVTDPSEQMQQYLADAPKSVVELQPFRRTQVLPVAGAGGRQGTATLIDLNPAIGRWFLLTLDWGDGQARHFHLESHVPGLVATLDPGFPGGLLLGSAAEAYRCDLWSGTALLDAASQATPHAPLCEGRLYLRNAVRGHSSNLEVVVDFLRRHVPAGERLITATKQTVLRDAGREAAELSGHVSAATGAPAMPAPAQLAPGYAEREIGRGSLGITVADTTDQRLMVGQWTAVADAPGVFLSLLAPEAIAPEILRSARDRANALDARESAALVYSVAFDLGQLALGFGLGTANPDVGWSPRPPPAAHPQSLPGPDGIGSVRPLVNTGMVPPGDRERTVATFVGGFKRYHGAFKYGAFALRNHGSHYGFIQEGVVQSKLQPGLSTLYVLRDGSVHMHAWREADNERLAEVRFARQNGVPLVEWDATTGMPLPGDLVNQWGGGNWSGSAEGDLRTVRAGACLQETAVSRYLIYAYFSSATPSAMARVFQAYGCRHAMQLDINAPILTYLALYHGSGQDLRVQYLVQSMVEAEQKVQGRPVPRFVVMPDNRDFFYLMRRGGGAP